MGLTKRMMEEKEAAKERLARAKGWKCDLCGELLLPEDLGIQRGSMTVCPGCMHSIDKMEAE